MASQNSTPALSQSDIDHFLQHGWIKLSNCFTQEQADKVTANVWTRLGMDPNDKSTWTAHRTNMPAHNRFDAAAFAPRAWAAIAELVGGEDRIADGCREWGDGLIVNLGSPGKDENADEDPRELKEWHVDGDFFAHYLDSPEQALLVIPLFTPIPPGGGGTMLCPPAIPLIARHLRDHPEGVSPRMTPRAGNPRWEPEAGLEFFNRIAREQGSRDGFVEATGEVGDVYLLHPLMLHAASGNRKRNFRVITNPPVGVKEPMRFDREDEREFSPVERKTLRELGVERLEGWKIEGTRDAVVPERVRRQRKMAEEEKERLMKMGAGVKVEEVTAVA